MEVLEEKKKNCAKGHFRVYAFINMGAFPWAPQTGEGEAGGKAERLINHVVLHLYKSNNSIAQQGDYSWK